MLGPIIFINMLVCLNVLRDSALDLETGFFVRNYATLERIDNKSLYTVNALEL